MESVKLVVRGRMGRVIKVGGISLVEASKVKGIMNNGLFVITTKDAIWVIVMTHRVAIAVESLIIWQGIIRTVITTVCLAIWQRIVRIIIIVGRLVILLKIILTRKV